MKKLFASAIVFIKNFPGFIETIKVERRLQKIPKINKKGLIKC